MPDPHAVVFLPVPEELEAEVTKLVTALILSGSLRPWDAPTMASLVDALDDEQRAVLLFVARVRTEESRSVTDAETAEATGLSILATRAVLGELEEMAGERSRAVLVLQRPGAEGPHGPTRELFISMPFARLAVGAAGDTA